MKDLRGRTAIVTGASRGIGPFIARALYAQGMNVVVAARSRGELDAVRAELDPGGDRSLAVTADVAVAADCQALLVAAVKRFGQVDVLVNNAGVEGPEPFVDMDFARAEQTIAVNLVALMRMTHLVLPGMLERRSGHIVHLASLAGLSHVPFNAVYSASKHGVVGFSDSLRFELDGTGVGVSAVCPGFVRDAGMFTQYAAEDAPILAGTSSPQEVADGVVKAITKDRARVLVMPALARITPALNSVAPTALYEAMRRGGIIAALRTTANRNRDEAASARKAASAAPAPRAVRAAKPATPEAKAPRPRRKAG